MNPETKKTVLSIDFGSTSLRAILLELASPSGNVWHKIQNPEQRDGNYHSGEGEWPIALGALGEPRDPHEHPGRTVWLGYDASEHLSISGKYGIIWLAGILGDNRDQYCVVDPLYNHRDPERLRERLHVGLRELLGALRNEVDNVCRTEDCVVERVVLSVPAQWVGTACEDIYRAIVAEVFVISEEARIEILSEIEAVAHYAFRENVGKSLRGGEGCHAQRILYIDSGGHSMNLCEYYAVYNPDGKGMPCIYRTSQPQGFGGGSEHWEFRMLEDCNREAKKHPKRGGRDLPPAARNQMAVLVNTLKRGTIGPGSRKGIQALYMDNESPCVLNLSPEDIHLSFGASFDGILHAAGAAMESLAQVSRNSLVVVSGGSSLNPHVRERLCTMFTASGLLKEPIFVEKHDRPELGLKVVKGAAYASGRRPTARDFFENNAAFGLQRLGKVTKARDREGLGNGGEVLLTNDKRRAILLFKAPGSGPSAEPGTSQFNIICDPFYASPHRTQLSALSPDFCYDILKLGELQKGTYVLDIALEDSHDNSEDITEECLTSQTGQRGQGSGSQATLYPSPNANPLYMKIKIMQSYKTNTGVTKERTLLSVVEKLYIGAGSNCVFLPMEDADGEPAKERLKVALAERPADKIKHGRKPRTQRGKKTRKSQEDGLLHSTTRSAPSRPQQSSKLPESAKTSLQASHLPTPQAQTEIIDLSEDNEVAETVAEDPSFNKEAEGPSCADSMPKGGQEPREDLCPGLFGEDFDTNLGFQRMDWETDDFACYWTPIADDKDSSQNKPGDQASHDCNNEQAQSHNTESHNTRNHNTTHSVPEDPDTAREFIHVSSRFYRQPAEAARAPTPTRVPEPDMGSGSPLLPLQYDDRQFTRDTFAVSPEVMAPDSATTSAAGLRQPEPREAVVATTLSGLTAAQFAPHRRKPKEGHAFRTKPQTSRSHPAPRPPPTPSTGNTAIPAKSHHFAPASFGYSGAFGGGDDDDDDDGDDGNARPVLSTCPPQSTNARVVGTGQAQQQQVRSPIRRKRLMMGTSNPLRPIRHEKR
ncbi:hypothetical protein Micbo1qcDRAFT_164347 [Microdochium bolleyi]|uniref:Actin-like ATPase domain-containing protein n=1 Tax=Microdochium bolleyi TaxID=196109 RepID=A0A136J0K8_9PEZI|nr:hypothetical protein Micbo1qcDRAFT_164347 [Microdochium bolleyi]